VWGVSLARLVGTFPEDRRHMIDPGLLEVTAANTGLSAVEMMEFDLQRGIAANAMALFHQRFDLVLCPTVPGPPLLADAMTVNPIESLWQSWAPWTLAFNLTRQPAITVPMGFTAAGLPRSVQIAAAQYRDDLVLRAARSLEQAQPFPMPDLA
jgi:aspartyl-tRNA(Asn)/glutamyl-tRNA(Gln) amidotransferase subunit A